jgi:hypothetical protein
MSTLIYATATRPKAPSKGARGEEEEAPQTKGVSTYVQTVAALVPAEILTLHAVILTFTTETATQTAEATGKAVAVTTITEPTTLFWAFWGLVATSVLLYAVPHLLALKKSQQKWELADWFRMLIPPLAFVVWTMLQRSTAFDAVLPGLTEAPRTLIALFAAVFLILGATGLSYKKPEVS